MVDKTDKKSRRDSVWDKRAANRPALPFDDSAHIDPATIRQIVERRPFLQIISTEPNFSDTVIPEFYTASSGWTIHDYGDAMSSSLGEQLFSPGTPAAAQSPNQNDDDDETGGEAGGTADDETGGSIGGTGTVIGVVVALSMASIVIVSNLIGMSLPFIFTKIGQDPTVASSPLITSIADAAGLTIYFFFASQLLSL